MRCAIGNVLPSAVLILLYLFDGVDAFAVGEPSPNLPGLPDLSEVFVLPDYPKPKPFPFIPPNIIRIPDGSGSGSSGQGGPHQPGSGAGSNPLSLPDLLQGELTDVLLPSLLKSLESGFSEALARYVGANLASFMQKELPPDVNQFLLKFAQQVLDSAKQQLGQPKGPGSPVPANPPPPPVPAGPANPPQRPDPNNPAPPPVHSNPPPPQAPTGAGDRVPPQPPKPESHAQTPEILKALADLRATGIFPEDHGFMRKVAWQESRDGELLGKSSEFVRNGGIWQIDPVGLEGVQKNLPQDKKTALTNKFGVDVSKVNRDNGDLLNVRTAAAVARAFVYRQKGNIPPDDGGQAAYWKEHYNTPNGKGTEQQFLEGLNTMPKQ